MSRITSVRAFVALHRLENLRTNRSLKSEVDETQVAWLEGFSQPLHIFIAKYNHHVPKRTYPETNLQMPGRRSKPLQSPHNLVYFVPPEIKAGLPLVQVMRPKPSRLNAIPESTARAVLRAGNIGI